MTYNVFVGGTLNPTALVGCIYYGMVINLLAYADDMVVLAPSWRALQTLLVAIEDAADRINVF